MSRVAGPKADFYAEDSPYELSYEAGREMKSLKTVAVIADAVAQPLSELRALEIGCFTGEVSLRLAPHFREYHAVDIDDRNIERALEKGGAEQVSFSVMDAEALQFPDASFDVLLCSHVYEHVRRPTVMMREIRRVLKPGGICYFAAGNRLCLLEPHHRLPLLTFLPKGAADLYLRVFRNKPRYEEQFLLLPQLRKLVQEFVVQDYTLGIIRHPEKFHATDMLTPGSCRHLVASLLLPRLYFLIPTYIWVLRKEGSTP